MRMECVPPMLKLLCLCPLSLPGSGVENRRAVSWYRRLGYTADSDCPSRCDPGNTECYDYLILSRRTDVRTHFALPE
jgi:hypothetical protein